MKRFCALCTPRDAKLWVLLICHKLAAHTLVVMNTATADLLKHYRDLGIQRVNIGVGVDNWERPEVVMPMIEGFARLIPELAA